MEVPGSESLYGKRSIYPSGLLTEPLPVELFYDQVREEGYRLLANPSATFNTNFKEWSLPRPPALVAPIFRPHIPAWPTIGGLAPPRLPQLGLPVLTGPVGAPSGLPILTPIRAPILGTPVVGPGVTGPTTRSQVAAGAGPAFGVTGIQSIGPAQSLGIDLNRVTNERGASYTVPELKRFARTLGLPSSSMVDKATLVASIRTLLS